MLTEKRITFDECVHQSGEVVVECGHYELVGSATQIPYGQPSIVVTVFHKGDIFPDFNGRSVCWHYAHVLETHDCGNEADSQPDIPNQHVTPWQ